MTDMRENLDRIQISLIMPLVESTLLHLFSLIKIYINKQIKLVIKLVPKEREKN
jgi:hypothetical protein